MEQAIEKYRHISVPCASSDGLEDAITGLNARFRPDDFHVMRNGDTTLDVWVREINIDDLRSATAAIISDYPGAVEIKNIPIAVEGVRSYGVNGRKRLFVGYNNERKVADRKAKEKRRGKHYYANDHSFHKKHNSLPSKYEDAVICGDSEEVLKKLPDNSVDLIFTSPPYNFGLAYSEDADTRDWHSYFDKLFGVFDECIRVLRFGGRIAVNVQPLFSDYIPSHHIISDYFMRKRMIWKGEILWEKNNYNCKYTAWGSWKSPASPYLKYTWEFVEVFCKGQLKKSGDPAKADIDAESFKKWVVAKWSIAPERRMKDFGHPAMFPVELAQRILLLFSFNGDVVLDPFAGVGTTCVAARQLGRRFVGIDVSEEYCNTAQKRLDNAIDIFTSAIRT